MSPRTPRLNAKQIIKQLKNAGFTEIGHRFPGFKSQGLPVTAFRGQTGSHLKLFNQETRRTAIIPIHSSKVIPVGTLKAIEKQSDIKFEQCDRQTI